MPKVIPGYVGTRGQPSAPVMIIGEAPGHQEVIQGKPFVGASGNLMWNELKQVGIHLDDCYVTNVCKVNPGTFPDGKRGAELMKAWAPELDEEMKEASPKVVLLVGGKALQRVTSFTSIKDWRGSVMTGEDLPNTLVWHRTAVNAVMHPTSLPPSNPYVIPTLHPAGIMRSKGREDVVLFKRDLKKVSKILSGKWKSHLMNTHFRATPGRVAQVFRYAKRVYFDTEFNPQTGEMFWVGMSHDGVSVYGFPWVPVYYDVVRKVMEDSTVEKGAHNIIADIRVMKKAGIEVRGKTYCTMIGMYVLHPDQMVGLSPTSRYYLDDVKYHKWMEKTDPVYNAYDVSYGWGSWDGQLEEAKGRPVDPMPEMEARQRLIPVCAGMEERGMPVDKGVQRQLIKEQRGVIKSLMKEVTDSVAPRWESRVRGVVEELYVRQQEFEALRQCYQGRCKKHPKYYPSKKPSATCEACVGLKEEMGEVFTKEYEKCKKARTALKTRLKTWEEGFNYKSSEHLIWFLYTELKLPIQRQRGKVTSNANAIERLSKLKSVQKKAEAFSAVQKMKKMQQASKAITFLKVPLKKGVAHPPYKIHGTVTGRLAGGEDKRGELDKVTVSGAFNVLNIPKKWRKMYVPPSGKCLVAADWCLDENTLIDTPCGDTKIKGLTEGDLVFSADKVSGRVSCQKVEAVYDRGKQEVWKVAFEDGSTVVATPEHKFITRSGERVELKDMNVGDSIMHMRRVTHPDGYIHCYTRTAFEYTKEHIAVFEGANPGITREGFDIHHKDGDPANNKLGNLELLAHAEHNKLHFLGKKRPEHGELIKKMWREGKFIERVKNLKGSGNGSWKGGGESRKCKHCGKAFWVSKLSRPNKFCGHSCSCKHYWASKKGELNHKVVRINRLIGKLRVIDITVANTHTFVLANGVVSSNCNQEGRIFAHLSQDRAYLKAFKEEDAGGYDVHCLNAHTVFGVDPADARKTKMKFAGQLFPVRHCAKVANHAWSYSPTPAYTLMKNFQLTKAEAIRIDDVLSAARPQVVVYKKSLVREVLGEWAVGGSGYAYCVTPGTRFYSNAFGWQVYYWGMGEVRVDQRTGEKVAYPAQAGELIAQGPQSTGASMFARCAYDVDQRGGVLYTGTYDNLILEVDDTDIAREEAAKLLKKEMEREWAELEGLVIPVDVEWGYNMGPYVKGENEAGLRSV